MRRDLFDFDDVIHKGFGAVDTRRGQDAQKVGAFNEKSKVVDLSLIGFFFLLADDAALDRGKALDDDLGQTVAHRLKGKVHLVARLFDGIDDEFLGVDDVDIFLFDAEFCLEFWGSAHNRSRHSRCVDVQTELLDEIVIEFDRQVTSARLKHLLDVFAHLSYVSSPHRQHEIKKERNERDEKEEEEEKQT